MEDIKILEDLINRFRNGISLGVVNEWNPSETFAQAIGNLIARNKELEEENRTLKEDYQTENQYYKEKIEEKIEELNDYDSKFCQRVLDHNEHTLTELIQNILQELLED